MTTTVEHLVNAAPVLDYAHPGLPAPTRLPRAPWLAIATGVIAWVPVLLSMLTESADARVAAVALGLLGLLAASASVIDPLHRPLASHVTSAISLLLALIGSIIAIQSLLS
jgi:hypothetical protein